MSSGGMKTMQSSMTMEGSLLMRGDGISPSGVEPMSMLSPGCVEPLLLLATEGSESPLMNFDVSSSSAGGVVA